MWREKQTNFRSRSPELSGRQTNGSRTDHRKPQSTEEYFLALSVDLGRAERDHCAAKGSRHGQGRASRAEGRCLLGGWRQALVSEASTFLDTESWFQVYFSSCPEPALVCLFAR